MIKIFFQIDKKKNFLKEIILTGHSGYAFKGRDIVCAAVSAIVNGTINFLDKRYRDRVNIFVSKSKVKVSVLCFDEKQELCLRLMFYQLENVSLSYPEYLSLSEIS